MHAQSCNVTAKHGMKLDLPFRLMQIGALGLPLPTSDSDGHQRSLELPPEIQSIESHETGFHAYVRCAVLNALCKKLCHWTGWFKVSHRPLSASPLDVVLVVYVRRV